MRVRALAAVVLLFATVGFAKDKAKKIMPPYVLTARSVAVVIDPDAGRSLTDPEANRVAQKDVETALLNWGRLEPMISTQDVDLIIVVRRGTGKFVDETIHDPRQGDRPGVINPTDNGISIGAQQGSRQGGPPPPERGPQTEVGSQYDSFAVYQGNKDDPKVNPLDNAPAWRYIAKDGLHPHTVPAVAEFRKAIADAEQAAAKHP